MFLVINKKIMIWLGLAVVILIAALGILNLFFKDNVKTSVSGGGNWGLSFQSAGDPPEANATASELKKYNAYYIEETDEKVMYLTFDAGYENGCTAKILDTLKKHKIPAAFFLVGNYIESEPELVKRMVSEGHIVGNHTFSHPDMSAISLEDSFRNELESLEKLYKGTTGLEMMKIYRPPQGRYSESNLQMAKNMGYTTVFWSLAYVDWYDDQQPTREEAFKKLIPRIHPGAIVLLHSTSATNAEILDELIIKWKEMGYSFRSIENFLE